MVGLGLGQTQPARKSSSQQHHQDQPSSTPCTRGFRQNGEGNPEKQGVIVAWGLAHGTNNPRVAQLRPLL